MSSVQQRIAQGAVWMIGARWIDKVLGLVSTFVLARLLVPEDFGLVAIASAMVALTALLSNFSFDLALIQHPAPTRGHYDTVWTITVLCGAAVGIALLAVASPLAAFYEEPRLTAVIMVLAVSAFIGSLANVGCVDFRRNLQFRREFLFSFYRRLLTLPIAIGLAFWLRSYWALVLGTLAGSLVSLLLSYGMHPFRPRWSLGQRAELFGFSKWLFLSNLLGFLIERAPDFMIGKMRGPRELGLFSIASEFGRLPAAELVAPINRAAFPGYSRLASDRPQLVVTYLRMIGVVASIALPAGIGIALTAPLFVPLLLGPKWTEAVPLLQLLALASALLALWTNTGYVCLAIGKPRNVTFLVGFQAALTVLSLAGFLRTEIPNAAGWALLTTAATIAVPNLYLWRRDLGIPWSKALGGLWRPLIACVALTATVTQLQAAAPPPESTARAIALLAACIGAGAGAYVVSALVLWWLAGKPVGAESYALAGIKSLITRR